MPASKIKKAWRETRRQSRQLMPQLLQGTLIILDVSLQRRIHVLNLISELDDDIQQLALVRAALALTLATQQQHCH